MFQKKMQIKIQQDIMFEKNMAKQIDESKNDWFRNNDPLYDYGEMKLASTWCVLDY